MIMERLLPQYPLSERISRLTTSAYVFRCTCNQEPMHMYIIVLRSQCYQFVTDLDANTITHTKNNWFLEHTRRFWIHESKEEEKG
jgi:hypothetical protein